VAVAASRPRTGDLPLPSSSNSPTLTQQDLRNLLRRVGRVLTDPPAFFLDPARQRYVVISVDPAGGGALSDEAMAIFLVADDQFGLLSGRVVPSSNNRYGMAMVPLVFVLSLLHTVREVHAWLKTAHTAAGHPPATFQLPPFLVLIENNYAYGAATYMQMLWLIDRQCKRPSWNGVEIVFATPVYGLNEWLVRKYDERKVIEERQQRAQAEKLRANRALRTAWEQKGKRRGENFAAFNKAIRDQAAALIQTAPDSVVVVGPDAVERAAQTVVDELIQRVRDTGAVVTNEERLAFLKEWLAKPDRVQY
jgi:hypothetical protein